MIRGKIDGLLACLKELEDLLRFPSVSDHVVKASQLALSIALAAPNESVADLAKKLFNEVARRRYGAIPAAAEADLASLVGQLRTALLDAEKRK